MILKFEGCYHGHGDSFLVKAGSGVATLGLPNSPGVPKQLSELTLSAPFNDLNAVDEVFRTYPGRIAGVIVEPVLGNGGFITPDEEFLPGLRRLTEEDGSLLIFDEVMTGFRVSRGGAQRRFEVRPDITTLGKVIGGGLPVGAYGGRRDIMERVAPLGDIYQAGTLSGNPLAMAAGLTQLSVLNETDPFEALERRTARLVSGIVELIQGAGFPATGGSLGSMWGLFFSERPVRNFSEAQATDIARFRSYFHACLSRGVFFAPSAFEAGFTSTAHDERDIDDTLDRVADALGELS
ncbi:MAG: glutamate-1-semialdehyde 2,1-aminomutase [Rhodospirillales bacterium]